MLCNVWQASLHLADGVHGQLRHADIHGTHAQARSQDGPDGRAAGHVRPNLQNVGAEKQIITRRQSRLLGSLAVCAVCMCFTALRVALTAAPIELTANSAVGTPARRHTSLHGNIGAWMALSRWHLTCGVVAPLPAAALFGMLPLLLPSWLDKCFMCQMRKQPECQPSLPAPAASHPAMRAEPQWSKDPPSIPPPMPARPCPPEQCSRDGGGCIPLVHIVLQHQAAAQAGRQIWVVLVRIVGVQRVCHVCNK